MIGHIKLISNIYAVKLFHNIFRLYCRILTPVLVITFFLGLISINPQIFESGILEPYRSSLLIAITISAIVFFTILSLYTFYGKEEKMDFVIFYFCCNTIHISLYDISAVYF